MFALRITCNNATSYRSICFSISLQLKSVFLISSFLDWGATFFRRTRSRTRSRTRWGEQNYHRYGPSLIGRWRSRSLWNKQLWALKVIWGHLRSVSTSRQVQISMCHEMVGSGLPNDTQDFHLRHRELSIGMITPSAMSTTISGRTLFLLIFVFLSEILRFFKNWRFLSFFRKFNFLAFKVLVIFFTNHTRHNHLYSWWVCREWPTVLTSATKGHFRTCIPFNSLMTSLSTWVSPSGNWTFVEIHAS